MKIWCFWGDTHTRSHIHKPPYLSGGQQPLRENSCRLTCTIVPSALPVWGACVVWIQWGVREITAAVRQTLHHRDREWSDNKRHKCSQPTSPIFVFTHRFYMRVPLRSRLCTGLSFQSKSPGNVVLLFDISAATWQMLKIILCSSLSPFFVLMKNNHNSQQ